MNATERAQLTEQGFNFAASVAEDSIVARVALNGYEPRDSSGSWPDSHVTAAIETCNAKGANEND